MKCDRDAIREVTETMLRLRIAHESSRDVNAWRAGEQPSRHAPHAAWHPKGQPARVLIQEEDTGIQ